MHDRSIKYYMYYDRDYPLMTWLLHHDMPRPIYPIDYRLLEEIERADEVARRCRPPFPKHQLPPHLSTLVYQANRRRIDLRLMNPGMHRRLSNSTR